MPHNIIEIDSIQSFISHISSLKDDIWYRGEPLDFRETRLTPSIFRGGGYNEKAMYIEFTHMHYSKYNNFNKQHWLCLMQHYDLPTRLLDWTENPLIASYFASQDNSNDGYIYSIDPRSLNNKSGIRGICLGSNDYVVARSEMTTNSKYSEIHLSKIFHDRSSNDKTKIKEHLEKYSTHPIALYPEVINERMLIQASRFTIHGGYNIQTTKNIDQCVNMNIFKINKACKESFRLILKKIFIHEGSLYPEIEYSAKHLKQKYKHDTIDISSF